MTEAPYRNLAGELRRAMASPRMRRRFAFSLFHRADYLRCHVKAKRLALDFLAALTKSPEAGRFPRWSGPVAP